MPFDPNKSFKAVGSAPKRAFDPSKPFKPTTEAPTMPPNAPGSASEAALSGFGQSASMGYLPQLQAATETGIVDPLTKLLGKVGIGPGAVNEQLKASGATLPDSPSYVEARDRALQQQEQLRKAHPVATAAGSVGGTIATTPIMGAGLKALGIGGNALKATVAAGALQGGLYNPGDVAGEISPLQVSERAKGAAIGAAIPIAMKGIGTGLKYGAGRVMESATGTPTGKGLGVEQLEQGLYGFKSGMQKQIPGKIQQAEQGLMKELSDIPVSELPPAKVMETLVKYKSQLVSQDGKPLPGAENALKMIESLQNKLMNNKLSATDLRNTKKIMGEAVNWESADPGLKGRISKDLNAAIKDDIIAQAEQVHPQKAKNILGQFKKEEALYKAQQGLADDGGGTFDKLSKFFLKRAVPYGAAAAAGVGAPVIVAAELMNTPAFKSTAAQIAYQMGKAIDDPEVINVAIRSVSEQNR